MKRFFNLILHLRINISFSGEHTRPRVFFAAPRREGRFVDKLKFNFPVGEAPTAARGARALPDLF
jgi:hypothetical protein